MGLPHWVWVSAGQWRPLTKRAAEGSVWAEITATPQRIIVRPGVGLSAMECAGPGAAYDPGKPSTQQRTDCSYTYQQSSAGQKDGAFTVTVQVEWSATWVGSGSTSGVLPNQTMSTSFPVRIAEGQTVN